MSREKENTRILAGAFGSALVGMSLFLHHTPYKGVVILSTIIMVTGFMFIMWGFKPEK